MNTDDLPRWLLVAALTAPILGALPAAAQSEQADEVRTYDTVVVTAQRREESLQDVPVAVTAFSADQLEKNSIETVQDLALRTPGLTVGAADPINNNFALRGIGTANGISQSAGGDQSVVVFVDGVYAGRGGTVDLDVLDLERVEVLRGPQGTLFGKNAIGGLIQYVSRKPSDEESFFAKATAGNYNKVDLSTRANLPLSDKLFLAIGIANKQRDGYELNQTTGNRVNDQNITTARAALRFVPNDELDIVLRSDFSWQDQLGNPRTNNCDETFNGGVHCVGVNPDPRVVNAYIDGYIIRNIQSYSAEVNWESGFGTVTSLTALRDVDYKFRTPFFSNPVNPPTQIESTDFGKEEATQFSQELRLAFDAFDTRLQGQLGVYYLDEQIDRRQGQIQDFPVPSVTGIAIYPQSISASSFAVFGQFDYALTDKLTATAGARMTWEEKKGDFQAERLQGPGIPPPLGSAAGYDVTGSEEWEAFTPRVALNWDASETMMFYASAARGYKSGGFQGLAGTAAGASTPYDPEFAWNYEIGAKTEWLDRRLTLNAAIFKTDYEDLQISQLIPLCCVVVTNAAKAEITGVEIEFIGRPSDNFQVDGSYSYLDAEFTEYLVPGSDYTGNQLPRAPENKFNIGAQFEFPIGTWQALARADYSWADDAYFEASNVPQQIWAAHENIDARLTLTPPDSPWEFAVWGKNLTDELTPTYVTYFGPYRQTLVPYAPPKTYGVSLSYTY
ncbi:TonB-dependent receptor [Henriciella pelagia]|jgi:iron complex outermembrane recepter protein|uniref:TonB-dependent receptor n=1 Tax=Henriciella pelagia TaxID=1977912 RepID=A0ABQ1JE67_9PROT|nr:TonB-dependent receptor [Henriciella pelagia]GGB64914.1 TonB-dependent receptor [Henriciella pelagia]